jgi:hypothetical protein
MTSERKLSSLIFSVSCQFQVQTNTAAAAAPAPIATRQLQPYHQLQPQRQTTHKATSPDIEGLYSWTGLKHWGRVPPIQPMQQQSRFPVSHSAIIKQSPSRSKDRKDVVLAHMVGSASRHPSRRQDLQSANRQGKGLVSRASTMAGRNKDLEFGVLLYFCSAGVCFIVG